MNKQICPVCVFGKIKSYSLFRTFFATVEGEKMSDYLLPDCGRGLCMFNFVKLSIENLAIRVSVLSHGDAATFP